LESFYNLDNKQKLHISIENKSNYPIQLMEIMSSEKSLYKFR